MTQDVDVIHQILQGDTESFSLLVAKYQKPIVRMIRNITNNRNSCEDLAQDVFFMAYKNLASFDLARSSFSTWLFTIAKNKSLNAIKKKRPLSMGQLPEKTHQDDPFDNLAQTEFFDALDTKLQTLSPRQKIAFVLAEFEKLPYQQIAQIEGVRVGTIKSRINRAKEKLRLALKSFEEDDL
jgi:RNA polymerase sigma-70 factor (ECF subfamily)